MPPASARRREDLSGRGAALARSAKSVSQNSGRILMTLGPGIELGRRRTQASASSMLATSHSQKPATSSDVASNGPWTTWRCAPSNATRRPSREGLSPAASSRMPAGSSSALNRSIAAKSAGKGMTPA